MDKKGSNFQTASLEDLENVIDRAIKRVGGVSENDICKYLPGKDGGYMHHFTLRKMASENPAKLSGMINEFIINSPNPRKLPPKTRAARGSRKRKDFIALSKTELEDMISIARQIGRKDIAAKLSPRKSLNIVKRELINCIKQSRIDNELWRSYTDAVSLISDAESATAPVAMLQSNS